MGKTTHQKTILIAGGGTGGHIYPALSIAKALERQIPGVRIEFVGTRQGMEGKIVPREGYPLHFVQGGKLNFSGRWKDKVITLLKLPLGFIQSVLVLWQKRPDYVLGVGGYASAPMVLMASLLGFRTGIWEPNVQPGLANRWLSRFVDDCFLVFEEAQGLLKSRRVYVEGMPVREQIEQAAQLYETEDSLAGEAGSFRILCFGGSLGSRVINHALFDAISSQPNWSGVHLVHQIGSTDWKIFQEKYRQLQRPEGFSVEPLEFIYDMPARYRSVDIVICRAGASTLAEVAAFGVPPILIPLPAADNHQGKNAESLQRQTGASVISQNELTPQRLYQEILALKGEPQRRREISTKLRQFFKNSGAANIARIIAENTAEKSK